MNSPNNERMRIAIATSGRFHVLDLARELDKLGHEVRFYSYVPKRRAVKFGLPARCHVALLPWMAPMLAIGMLLQKLGWRDAADGMVHAALDRLVAWKLQPCDVFIGMSGIYLRAFRAARRRYGARLVLERGSVHIEAQREILEQVRQLNPHAQGVPARAIQRELTGYALADRIAVPSLHAEESFIARGMDKPKIFRNPYGVDLRMFHPNANVARDAKLILFVGGWSYQKGVDVLTRAMETLSRQGYRLQHVGSVADAPLPDAPWFQSAGSIDQSALPAWYQRASCMVLPSRQDGLGLVLIQALACGCPIVGSEMTGARDLQQILQSHRSIRVVPVDDADALVDAISACAAQSTPMALSAAQRGAISWPAYGQRYSAILHDLAKSTVTSEYHKGSSACA